MLNGLAFMVYAAAFAGALNLIAKMFEKVRPEGSATAISSTGGWLLMITIGVAFFGGLMLLNDWMGNGRSSSSSSYSDEGWECSGGMRC